MSVKQCHKPSHFDGVYHPWWFWGWFMIVLPTLIMNHHESSILGITRDPCQYRGHLLRSLCGCVRGARHLEGATGAGMASLKHPGVSSMGYPPNHPKSDFLALNRMGWGKYTYQDILRPQCSCNMVRYQFEDVISVHRRNYNTWPGSKVVEWPRSHMPASLAWRYCFSI